jgi:hypothetical protein
MGLVRDWEAFSDQDGQLTRFETLSHSGWACFMPQSVPRMYQILRRMPVIQKIG